MTVMLKQVYPPASELIYSLVGSVGEIIGAARSEEYYWVMFRSGFVGWFKPKELELIQPEKELNHEK